MKKYKPEISTLRIFALLIVTAFPFTASATPPGVCGIQEIPGASTDCSNTPNEGSSTQNAARALQAIGTELKKLEVKKQQANLLDIQQAEIEEKEAKTWDLSGGCTSAQDKGTNYVNKVATKAQTSVCQTARKTKLLGIITVRVAESCQEVASWQELRADGLQMVRESEATISGSCSR